MVKTFAREKLTSGFLERCHRTDRLGCDGSAVDREHYTHTKKHYETQTHPDHHFTPRTTGGISRSRRFRKETQRHPAGR